MKSRASVALEDSIKMAENDKDQQIQAAEEAAHEAEEEAGGAISSESGLKGKESALQQHLASTQAELDNELHENSIKLEQAKAEETTLHTKLHQLKKHIARQEALTEEARNTIKRLTAFRFVFKNRKCPYKPSVMQ